MERQQFLNQWNEPKFKAGNGVVSIQFYVYSTKEDPFDHQVETGTLFRTLALAKYSKFHMFLRLAVLRSLKLMTFYQLRLPDFLGWLAH